MLWNAGNGNYPVYQVYFMLGGSGYFKLSLPKPKTLKSTTGY
jgi:hypothetical protein